MKRILAVILLLTLSLPVSAGPAYAASVDWKNSFEDALKAASAANKPVMAMFYTSWCSYCRKLDAVTFVDPAVVDESRGFVCLRVDLEKRRDIAYGYGVSTVPSIFFLDPSGRVIWKEFGYRDPAFLSGRMAEVLRFFRKMAVAEPYIRSAFAEASRGNADAGVAILNGAIGKYGDDSRLYAARSLMHRYKGSLDAALADIDRAIALNPKADELYAMRGAIYYGKGQADKALEDYNRAVSANRWSYDAYNGRGIIYMDRGDADAAIRNFNAALLINPKNPGVYYNRAVAYINKNDIPKAVADLDAAIRLDPKFMSAYAARSTAYMKLGQYDKSWRDVETVEKLGVKMKPEFLDELRRLSGKGK